MTDPTSRAHHTTAGVRRGRGALLAAWMFPVLCWLCATLYLGGNLGKSTDDYSINLRDPATNALPTPFNPLANYPFFWRPLHNIMCFGVGTLWPDANRSVHIAVAAFHGLACLGLFAMMRRFCRTRLAPAIAAVLFMLFPLHGEVAFWFCTTSTAIGAAIFFLAALVAFRFAGAERARVSHIAAIFALVFLITCFYEQSAALCAALPFICLGATPPGQPWKSRIGRAMAATAAAGAACVLYVVLLLATAPASARGGEQSFVSREHLASRFAELLGGVRFALFGERANHIIRGSLAQGWETVQSPQGLLLGALLLATAGLWVVWAARRGGDHPDHEGATRPLWLFLAGAASFVAGWLPIYVIDHQVVELRNTYIPVLGLAMMLASALDATVSAARGRPAPAARLALSAAAVALAAPGIIGLIGYQALFQLRWRQDQREIQSLQRAIPNPPPNTVFMPFRLGGSPTHTGYILFDRSRLGVFETPWSAHAAIRLAYRRNDIGTISCSPWIPHPLVDKPDESGVRTNVKLDKRLTSAFASDPAGGVRIPWGSAVPFITDHTGTPRLVRRIDVQPADHRDLEIRPPLVHAALAKAADIPTAAFTLSEPEPENTRADLIPLRFWEFADGSPAKFEPMWIWGAPRTTTWLAAGYRERASMSIALPPLDHSENLLIRATMASYDLDPARNADARIEELVLTMDGAPKTELAVLRLDPSEMRTLKRWVSVVVSLPPRPAPAGDRLRITPRVPADPAVHPAPVNSSSPRPPDSAASILPIWVTHGYEQAITTQP